MTFYPDGQPDIPNQTPIPGAPSGSVPPGRPSHPSAQTQAATPDREFSKAIVRTAMINGVVLVIAVLLAFVFPITDDPAQATFIVLGAAVLTGAHLLVVIVAHQRRRREQGPAADVRSVPSLSPRQPAPAQPYGAVQPPTAAAGFVLRVEDVFTITGRGTVVTGRVESGQLHTGQSVVIQRGSEVLPEVEVNGIEKFGEVGQIASAGENVGLLLAGLARSDVQRGDLLTR